MLLSSHWLCNPLILSYSSPSSSIRLYIPYIYIYNVHPTVIQWHFRCYRLLLIPTSSCLVEFLEPADTSANRLSQQWTQKVSSHLGGQRFSTVLLLDLLTLSNCRIHCLKASFEKNVSRCTDFERKIFASEVCNYNDKLFKCSLYCFICAALVTGLKDSPVFPNA